jgi:DNA mismatch repair protein MutH
LTTAPPIYDKSSVESIFEHAKRLDGVALADLLPGLDSEMNQKNRGDLGSLVERHYFEHEPPNNHEPDFAEVGLELKTTGVRLTNGGYVAKERLVLTMINYESIVNEIWESSMFLKKCKLMLILFYEYDRETPVTRRRFVLRPIIHQLSERGLLVQGHEIEFLRRHAVIVPPEDLAQIRRDWETIKAKVLAGKAHELSEGDTYYLGACRKGPGGAGEALRVQPFSPEGAKGRAFSLKQGYMSRIIQSSQSNEVRLGVNETEDFEQVTKRKFDSHRGKTIEQLCRSLEIVLKEPKQKNLKRIIADRILEVEGRAPSELQMADIEMKTVLLNEVGKLKEHMSFPNFKYLEILDLQWEDSDFCERLERRFLFVVFQKDNRGLERLKKVFYWNMPFVDREEARRVWEETKRRVLINARDLPGARESHVAHVRPKARDSRDTEPTPQGERLVKKGFWLNNKYVQDIIAQSR